eukprot:2175738-Rhodomonas_salina.1
MLGTAVAYCYAPFASICIGLCACYAVSGSIFPYCPTILPYCPTLHPTVLPSNHTVLRADPTALLGASGGSAGGRGCACRSRPSHHGTRWLSSQFSPPPPNPTARDLRGTPT